ncbi:MAG: hypothetical protein A3G24_04065 [Betaproteobacteria bacterium RIFCSPLOWO2_12_FULL_62_13]|nr:MAG: hypothetical protein A3G24_04065 [Betaproteobacteria bacterium RIFCSPLOWO2_12_FULL_62_13]
MTHVAYKGAAPAMLDLMGGRITLMATSIGSSAGMIRCVTGNVCTESVKLGGSLSKLRASAHRAEAERTAS